jgi:hypothetical protein
MDTSSSAPLLKLELMRRPKLEADVAIDANWCASAPL